MGIRFTRTGSLGILAVLAVSLVLGPSTARALTTGEPALVLAQAETAAEDHLPEVYYTDEVLPQAVLDTRNNLLLAARSGDLAKLKPILDASKVKPIVSFGGDDDPIEYWRNSSIDGTGRDILAEMIKVFSSGFVHVNPGTKDALYIWPYHFVYPLDKLSAEQEVELYLLVPAEYRQDMEDAGGYIGFRAGIDPEGSLIFFVAGD